MIVPGHRLNPVPGETNLTAAAQPNQQSVALIYDLAFQHMTVIQQDHRLMRRCVGLRMEDLAGAEQRGGKKQQKGKVSAHKARMLLAPAPPGQCELPPDRVVRSRAQGIMDSHVGKATAMIRQHLYYSGRVQGVGFRYTALNCARSQDVTGFVRNLPDGRVELVIEGRKQDVQEVLNNLLRRMEGNISSVDEHLGDVTGEFADFRINY